MKKTIITVVLVLSVSLCKSQDEPTNKKIEDFKIIGISVETTNEKGQSVKDMGQLWQQFLTKQLSSKIPNTISPEVYALFTEYETDYTGNYRAIIGCKVSTLDSVPKGMIGWTFKGGNYRKFLAKGELPTSVVGVWQQIWKADNTLNRSYTTDFEVYGAKAQQGPNSEVEIYIAIQ